MKKTMKKITASLMALLMIIQIVPALGATYSSGTIVGTSQGFKEKLEIVATKGTYVLIGQTLELDVNEDYVPVWESADETIATVDKDGLVTAVKAGVVEITATQGDQKFSVEITVIDPEPLLDEVPAPEEEKPQESSHAEEPAEKPAQKVAMVIVINAENQKITYDGEEHLMNGFEATSNEDGFDSSKIKFSGDLGVKGTDCGLYELKLEDVEFTYDDPNVIARFVVNNGWLKITPAQVTVTANEAAKSEGEADPELTATVIGLIGDDTIEYTLTRESGEIVGEYIIEATGEEHQGNYKINYVAGKFEITGEPVVTIDISVPEGEAVYLGTMITMKAVPAGFGDVELAYQWQYSTDGENWTNIEGATEKVYKYELTRKNMKYSYRVFVEPVK